MWNKLIEAVLSIIPKKKKPPVQYAITPEYAELLQYPLYQRPLGQSRLIPFYRILGKIWRCVSTGITNIQDCYSTKWLTMEVISPSGIIDIIPLKKLSSDLIFVKIRGEVYPFILDATKIKTYQYKNGQTVRIIHYDIRDIRPIDFADLRRAKEYGDLHGIDAWDEAGLNAVIMAYNYLKDKEDQSEVYIEELVKHYIDTPNVSKTAKQWIEEIGTDKIIQPPDDIVRSFKQKLNMDVRPLAEGISRLKTEDWQHRKIANPAKTPFKGWIMIFALIGIIGAIAVGGWYADQEGLLSGDSDLLGGNVEDIDWESLQNLGSPQELLGGFELDPLDIIPENQTVLLQPDDEP